MAGKIPQSFLDELLTRSDIVDLIDSRVPLKKAGKEYKACCPFHEERTPSFTVSSQKQFYHCFGCGAHGTAIGFLMEYEHMEFVEAVEHLAARLGLEVPREDAPASPPGQPASSGVDLLTLVGDADRYFREQLRHHADAQQAVDYLKKRGLTGKIAAKYALGFAPDSWDALLKTLGNTPHLRTSLHRAGLLSRREGGGFYDRFRNRVIFPIQDHRGRVVGFGGRVLGSGEPKYLNSPETPLFHKGSELYGLYLARQAIHERNLVLVVEGYMDVLALAQHGIEYCVATLGTATTKTHLDRLFRHCSDVVFCFDGDRAGRDAAWKALTTALPVLTDGRQASFLFLPEGHDPDSLVRAEGPAEFERRLAGAAPLPDYLLEQLSNQVDLQRLDGRARLIELARPLVNRMPRGILRELVCERLASMARTHISVLTSVMTQTAAKTPKARNTHAAPTETSKSAVSRALTLLLQQPQLALVEDNFDDFADSDLPGVAMVFKLITMVREQPDLNTAAILERFRDTRYGPRLNALARSEQLMDEDARRRDFGALIDRIRQEMRDQALSRLLEREKDQPDSLDAERLRDMLKGRKPPSST